YHFPTLSPSAWLRALFEFQPILVLCDDGSVTLDPAALQQLVQHVAGSPELPLLDPPVYSWVTLDVAQHYLHGIELAAAVLPELVPSTCGPRLLALLTYLCQPYAFLAEQVVQAWRWDLASAPPLPPGLPGGGLTPGSEAFLTTLKTQIRATQVRAALAVNAELVQLYWRIGHSILDQEQQRGWGGKVIDQLAQDLRRESPELTGFSVRNLKYMRAFAKAWPETEFVQQVAAQIPWFHNCLLLDKVKVPAERE
nr:hypothetical protein [Tanacetum cinerariifolium]